MIVGFVSEYFTSGSYGPVQKLAERCQTGPAIAVTEGTAVGMQSTCVPVIALGIAVVVSYYVAGTYGVAIASLGMLATTGMVADTGLWTFLLQPNNIDIASIRKKPMSRRKIYPVPW